MTSLGLSQKDAQFKNKWRRRIKGGNQLTQVHLEKWPLKWSVTFEYQYLILSSQYFSFYPSPLAEV